MATLRECIAEFVDKPPGTVEVRVIHLARATERVACVSLLSATLGGGELIIQDAADGKALPAHPRRCALDPTIVRSDGEVGCLVSHVAAMRSALARGAEYLVLLEDDCTPSVSRVLELLRAWLGRLRTFGAKFSLPSSPPLLLLSSGGCYTVKAALDDACFTNAFNCTHAVAMSAEFMRAAVHLYEEMLKRGVMMPVDGMYGFLLRSMGWWALCPTPHERFFHQRRDTPSYVLGDGERPRPG